MRSEDAFHGRKGEIREMLVIDGVELLLFDEAKEVRKLEGRRPAGRKERGDSGNKIIQVGNVSEDVVRNEEICAPATREFPSGSFAEEAGLSWNPFGARDVRYVPSRLDAYHRYSSLREVLKQVPIVRSNLN